MNFDSIDWPAEAKRVARAFGLDEECKFEVRYLEDEAGKPLQTEVADYRQLSWKNGERYCVISQDEDTYLWCTYDKDDIWEFLIEAWRQPIGENALYIWIDSAGGAEFQIEHLESALPLAKGLFHLALLTDQIERQLELNITAHQKIEWAKEYSERYDL